MLGPRKVNAAGQKWAWSANAYAKNKAEAEKAAFAAARWQFLIVAGKVLNSRNVTPVPMEKPGVATRGAVLPVPS